MGESPAVNELAGGEGNALDAAIRVGEGVLTLRPLWQEARLLLFGHALMEKLVAPRKAITAHTRYRGPVVQRPSVWVVDGTRLVELSSGDVVGAATIVCHDTISGRTHTVAVPVSLTVNGEPLPDGGIGDADRRLDDRLCLRDDGR